MVNVGMNEVKAPLPPNAMETEGVMNGMGDMQSTLCGFSLDMRDFACRSLSAEGSNTTDPFSAPLMQ